MWVPLNSRLSIPWQHPAQMALSCYRMNIYTLTKNVSLIKAKGLFAESSFNMSINQNGKLINIFN